MPLHDHTPGRSDRAPGSSIRDLVRLFAWRLAVIVFLVSAVANLATGEFIHPVSVPSVLAAGLIASILCLPVLVVDVIRPAISLVQEEAVNRGQAAFRSVLQGVRDGVSLIDITGKIVFANRAVEQLRGFAPGKLVGRSIQSIASAAIAEVEIADIAAFLAGEPTQFLNQGPRELLGKNEKGDDVPLEISWNSLPAAGAQGMPLFVAISRDISARKRSEAALRESETLFRTLADTAPVLIWMADAEGTLNFLNKGWLDFRGHTLEEELDGGWLEGLHPDDYSRCLETYEHAVRERLPYEMEYRMRRIDGEYRWLLDRGVPRRSADGMLQGFVGICVDVTLRKHAEDALRASERHFRELLERLPVAVRIVEEGKVVFANQADATLHGYARPEDELGLDAASQVAPEELERLREYSRRRNAGEPAPKRYEVRRRRQDGSELLAESEVERTFFDGRPANLIVIRDLTDRKRVEVYERLLPICCVCGKIRDDHGVDQGSGCWQRLDQYLTSHSDAEFSHTFCPDCFLDYRRKNLLTK